MVMPSRLPKRAKARSMGRSTNKTVPSAAAVGFANRRATRYTSGALKAPENMPLARMPKRPGPKRRVKKAAERYTPYGWCV